MTPQTPTPERHYPKRLFTKEELQTSIKQKSRIDDHGCCLPPNPTPKPCEPTINVADDLRVYFSETTMQCKCGNLLWENNKHTISWCPNCLTSALIGKTQQIDEQPLKPCDTETPRTDALLTELGHAHKKTDGMCLCEMTQLARKLEQELHAKTVECERLKGDLKDAEETIGKINWYRASYADIEKQNAALKAAGGELANHIPKYQNSAISMREFKQAQEALTSWQTLTKT